MKKIVNVVCITGWESQQPDTIAGKVCQVLKSFWVDGEGQFRLKDGQGKIFVSPDIFWKEIAAI